MNTGKVVQVIGPVVDVAFDEKNLPPIYTAVRITSEGFEVPAPIDIVTEVQQHLGEGRVRAVAMQPTDGLVRDMELNIFRNRVLAHRFPFPWDAKHWVAS